MRANGMPSAAEAELAEDAGEEREEREEEEEEEGVGKEEEAVPADDRWREKQARVHGNSTSQLEAP